MFYLVLYIIDSVIFFLTLIFLLIANRYRENILSKNNLLGLFYKPVLVIHDFSVLFAFSIVYNLPKKYFFAYVIVAISAIRLILFYLDCRIEHYIIEDIRNVTTGTWNKNAPFSLTKSPRIDTIALIVKSSISKLRHFGSYAMINNKQCIAEHYPCYFTDRKPFYPSGRMDLKNCIYLAIQAHCLENEEVFDLSVFEYCELRLSTEEYDKDLLQIFIKGHDKITYDTKEIEFLFINCLYTNWKELEKYTNRAKILRVKEKLIEKAKTDYRKEYINQYVSFLIDTLDE